jgi:hypothetical protein
MIKSNSLSYWTYRIIWGEQRKWSLEKIDFKLTEIEQKLYYNVLIYFDINKFYWSNSLDGILLAIFAFLDAALEFNQIASKQTSEGSEYTNSALNLSLKHQIYVLLSIVSYFCDLSNLILCQPENCFWGESNDSVARAWIK